jgi:RNA polymerase sigma-70 factor (ECF subfamily)
VTAVRHLVLVDDDACAEPVPGQVVWSAQTHATMNNVVQLRRPQLGERDVRRSSDAAAASAIVRAGRGDESAFAEFYDAVSSVVYGTVLRVVRSPAMAEEVTQEVFLELWRQAPRFDAEKGSPRSWAATVAHRRAVDRVRSEQSARVRDDADARLAPRDQDEVVDQVTANAERSEVGDALAQLTDTQREAVSLAYYGGHTYREVAVLLGVPEGTVKTRIRDGLIKLRDLMGVTA